MPQLANRSKYEEALAADLALLLHQFAIAALHNPTGFPAGAAAGLTRMALIPQLEAIYRAAAQQAARETQTPIDSFALSLAARQWAIQTADNLAARLTGSIQQQLKDAEDEAIRQGVSIALLLLPMLSDVFGADRARGYSVTETTRGTTAGERHVLGDGNRATIARPGSAQRVAFWHLGVSKSGPCPVCRPLDGLPEHQWPSYARHGPPLHEHCQCWLEWV